MSIRARLELRREIQRQRLLIEALTWTLLLVERQVVQTAGKLAEERQARARLIEENQQLRAEAEARRGIVP